MNKFDILYNKYLNSKTPYLDWNRIEHIDESLIKTHKSLHHPNNETIHLLQNKLCIIKLNGGLGTTMGCTGPKSLLNIKDTYNFMDVVIKQSSKTPTIPLILMNSFYTDDETNRYIKHNYPDLNIISFNQNCYPRILKESMIPLDGTDKDYKYPPGHGDLLQSMYDKGICEQLINKNIEYAFISNIDNLGATVDYKIFNDIIENDIEFAIELTPKTKDDVKGGTLILYDDNYQMFELGQCNPIDLDKFTSLEVFKYFNTNNIWIKLDTVNKLIESDYIKNIDLIINNKKLKDGRDCIQLEYAIGSLVKFYKKIKCYLVSRERFIPVKTNNDLEKIRSCDYTLDQMDWNLTKQ